MGFCRKHFLRRVIFGIGTLLKFVVCAIAESILIK